jgi:hypothetical protein
MPYIDIESQAKFIELEEVLSRLDIKTAGGLNYVISQVMIHYLLEKGISYQTMNDIVGAGQGAVAEFQRRIVNPYEKQKALNVSMQGGDLYEGAVAALREKL